MYCAPNRGVNRKRAARTAAGMMSGQSRSIRFIIMVSFLGAFLFIRLSVFLAGAAHTEFARAAQMGLRPDARFHIGRNIILFGYHIHHFYFGILLMGAAGWMALVDSRLLPRRLQAVLYGAGLGLFMDEIGLLLTWGDYYSSLSYLLTLLLAALFLNIIFFPGFWSEMRKTVVRHGSGAILEKGISRNLLLVRVADALSRWIGTSERAALAFTGVLSLGVCSLVLLLPGFAVYWVSGLFLIQGLTDVLGALSRGGEMKARVRISLLLTGLLYLAAGALMLFYHRLLVYWLAAAFLIHGVSSLVRSLRGGEAQRAEPSQPAAGSGRTESP